MLHADAGKHTSSCYMRRQASTRNQVTILPAKLHQDHNNMCSNCLPELCVIFLYVSWHLGKLSWGPSHQPNLHQQQHRTHKVLKSNRITPHVPDESASAPVPNKHISGSRHHAAVQKATHLPSFFNCTSVMISNSSSMVPNPPGRNM